jgi:hypothetical protein
MKQLILWLHPSIVVSMHLCEFRVVRSEVHGKGISPQAKRMILSLRFPRTLCTTSTVIARHNIHRALWTCSTKEKNIYNDTFKGMGRAVAPLVEALMLQDGRSQVRVPITWIFQFT